MAIRKSEIRRLRRELISRTARVWSRLNKTLLKDLNEVTQAWLKEFFKYARKNIADGSLLNAPEISQKFDTILSRTLREALAQGYWLEHLYLQEMRYVNNGRKYRGKISLADSYLSDEKLRKILKIFIAAGVTAEILEEWHDIIPTNAIDWLNNYVPKLTGVLNTAVLEKTRDTIQKSLLEGSTLQERMKSLQDISTDLSTMTKSRIEAIARTEITRADTMGRLIAMKSNSDVIGVEFSAIMDDRTTEICASRHGLVMRIDDPLLPYNSPPLHVNCVLGDTLVSPIGKVSAYSKRVFDGDIFIIKTAGGNNLAGTPNHPVLTSRGWVPLCEIQEGDYVVCNVFRKRGNIINGENQQVVACIKDTTHAFFDNSKVRATPVPVSAEDFHHDWGKSDVAIIYTNRKLFNGRKSFINKQIVKDSFIFRDVIRSFFKHCKSVFFFFLKSFFSSFNRFMSFLCKLYAFFKSRILHTYKLLFMSISRNNIISEQNKPDSTRRNIESFSNSLDTYTLIMEIDDNFIVNSINGTFPLNAMFEKNIIDSIKRGAIFFAKFSDTDTREIIFDKVINIECNNFCGHVYNLQTKSGIFVANNIITHNCRSMLLAVTIYEYPDGLLTSAEFDEVPTSKQRPEDIEEVAKILDVQKVLETGALTDRNDPDYSRRDTHAQNYYKGLRNSESEFIVKKLSRNGDVSLKTAQKVYEHIFINEYELQGEIKRFDPSYDMAESIQRLLLGENIQEHDIILLHHERLEYELMNRYGKDYDTAHKLTCRKYDYSTALEKWKKETGH